MARRPSPTWTACSTTCPARCHRSSPRCGGGQSAADPVAAGPRRSTGNQVARWVGPYGGVIVVCIVIWAITSASAGRLTYFWPVWMLIPLVLGVAGQWFSHDNADSNAFRGARDDRRAARDERRARRRGY